MLQNKIYQNYIIEILKNFLLILFAFSVIAITVRAVSFLDLVVENGYPVSIYFKYSLLNIFGIAPKFIPFS
ncbi:LptF/LptG family permease, partial [Pelagibacteraceae bacterium]|nr:LptF/LptG family permease [Pelagibacteraceae bacterium]